MQWLRFEGRVRFHAVYVQAPGGYWTYCARFVRWQGVRERTNDPPARCTCCRLRIQHSYLVPPKLTRLLAIERRADVA
jgi:hypothetical protein